MVKYLKINKDFSLVKQEIVKKTPIKEVVKKDPVNHIWIYDRSGSMSGVLRELCRQMKDLSKRLPKGDTLTLGWFSSQGEFNFILKGFKISDSSDYKTLESVIDSNSTTIGMTCFSEILFNTEKVIEDLKVFSNTFSLNFFTDGYPCVSNYNKEVEDIFKAIKAIKGKLKTAMLVGYGSGYNKELMGSMAEKLGAILVHNSVVAEFTSSMSKFVSLTESSESKVEVPVISKDNLGIFQITPEGIILASLDEGKLYVNPSDVYYITKEVPKKDWIESTVEEFESALYASSLVLNQLVKTDKALEVIGKVGDKFLVDKLYNAFTLDEHVETEKLLEEAIQDSTKRFLKGKDSNYLPKEDAFCVFDLLNILMEDSEARFFPTHKNFKYKKISSSAKTLEGYPEFIYGENSECSFDNLTWNKKRLNLSVMTFIKGSVKLNEVDGKKPSQVGFAEEYPCGVYRTYSFISDGFVNVKEVMVKTSEDTYKTFKAKGIVIYDSFSEDGIYGLDLSGLSAINRSIAEGKTSATELCKLTVEENLLMAKLKVLKYYRDLEFPEGITSKGFSEEQLKFLEANGIDSKGTYNPPVVKEAPTDQYSVKTFEIKFHSMSSLPKIEDVLKKISNGKSLNKSDSFIKEGLDYYNSSRVLVEGFEDYFRNEWYESQIRFLNKTLKALRGTIQGTKFAVVLGKKWFDEFPSRNDTSIVVDGHSFTFEFSEEIVKI